MHVHIIYNLNNIVEAQNYMNLKVKPRFVDFNSLFQLFAVELKSSNLASPNEFSPISLALLPFICPILF